MRSDTRAAFSPLKSFRISSAVSASYHQKPVYERRDDFQCNMLTISCLLTFLIVFPVEGLVLPDRGSSQRLSTWSSHLAMATQSPEVMKIESLKRDDEEIEVEEIVVRVSKPKVVRSQALPFLVCPAPLVDCDYAGNVGFDPLGFAKDSELLAQYREAEIKHSRLAMLVCSPGMRPSAFWLIECLRLTLVESSCIPPGCSRLASFGTVRQKDCYIVWCYTGFGLLRSRTFDSQWWHGKNFTSVVGMLSGPHGGNRLVFRFKIAQGRSQLLSWEVRL